MKLFSWFLAAACFGFWSWLALTRPIGVTIDQASTALSASRLSTFNQLMSSPLPLNLGFQALWFKLVGTGEPQLRLLSLLILAVSATLMSLVLSRRFPSTSTGSVVIVSFTLPGLYILSLNHLPQSLSLSFFTASFLVSPVLGCIFLLLSGLASFTAWLVILPFSLWSTRRSKLFLLVPLFLLLWSAFHSTSYRQFLHTDLLDQTSPSKLAEYINTEQKTFYLSLNRTPFLTTSLRKLVFNKVDIALNLLIKRSAEIIDPTLWTAPISAWSITILSGIPPKGLWPILYYWQIPLLLLGLFGSFPVSWLLSGAIPLFIFNSSTLNSSVALLLLPFAFLLVSATSRLSSRPLFSLALSGFYLLSFAYFSYSVFYQYLDTQKSDLIAFRELYTRYRQLSSPSSHFVITNRFGPSDIMFDFYSNRQAQNVEFTTLDWPRSSPSGDRLYIGFTPEFVGENNPEKLAALSSARIVGRIDLPDELVYQYGKTLWLVQR